MKIIVANQAEKDLITRLFNVIYEFDILEYIHKETTKDTSPIDGSVNDDDFIIWSKEADILREEICYPRIEIDKNESDIKVEGELVTGTCRFCGIETMGIGEDGEGCTYEEYVDYCSEEKQKSWHCTECESIYYSVIEKKPRTAGQHNAMRQGFSHCGKDDYIFGAMKFQYKFDDAEAVAKYLTEFETGETQLSVRTAIPILELSVKQGVKQEGQA